MHLSDILHKFEKHDATMLGIEDYRQYSVFIPFIEKNDGIHVLFEVRSRYMRTQPGDICFPGGRVDTDDCDEQEAAVRETKEELGVPESAISNVSTIGYMLTGRRIIHVFVGEIAKESSINPNQAEVEEVFTVPLEHFLKEKPKTYPVKLRPEPSDDFPYELIQGGRDYPWKKERIDEPFYQYEDYVIWGLTARIITHMLAVLEEE